MVEQLKLAEYAQPPLPLLTKMVEMVEMVEQLRLVSTPPTTAKMVEMVEMVEQLKLAEYAQPHPHPNPCENGGNGGTAAASGHPPNHREIGAGPAIKAKTGVHFGKKPHLTTYQGGPPPNYEKIENT